MAAIHLWSCTFALRGYSTSLPVHRLRPLQNVASAAPSSANAAARSNSGGGAWSAALRFAPRKSNSGNRPGAKSRHAGNVSSSIAGIASSFGESAEAPEPDEPIVAPKDDPTPPAPVVATNVHEASRPDGRQATVDVQPVSAILPSVGVASSSSKYILPTVTSPPELRLPQEEIDADRAKARAAAAARGESKRSEAMAEWEEWGEGADEDEDVNGFRNTSAGAKSRKKVSERVGPLPL